MQLIHTCLLLLLLFPVLRCFLFCSCSLPVRWKDDDAADAIALGAVRAPACDMGGQYCS